jgi:two-component system OmpR family response regulator
VLLVHDPETMPLPLATILEQDGFLVVQAHDGVQALCAMHYRHFDVVVTDGYLPNGTGLDLLNQLHIAWSEIPTILFAEVDWDTCDRAELLGAFAWIRKSSDPGILLSLLALALEQNVVRESVWALEEVTA